MKTLLITLLLASAVTAQRTVSNEYYDDSVRAFAELVASRQVIDADARTIKAQSDLVLAQSETIAVLKAQNADLAKLKCEKTSYLFGIVKTTRCR